MKTKVTIFMLILALAIVFCSAASATTTPQPVTSASYNSSNSAISGHKIVYQNMNNTGPTYSDIYMKDLTTGKTSVVTNTTRDEIRPDISGNIVVWQSAPTNSAGNTQVYYRDMGVSGSTPKAIYPVTGVNQMNPKISGNNVIWTQYTGAGPGTLSDVKGFNLATKKYYNITSSGTAQADDINGTTVLYNSNNNVYKTYINSPTNSGTKISAFSGTQSLAVISSNGKAAWMEKSSTSDWNIAWVSNVWTSTTKNIINLTGNDNYPDISGNIIVWLHKGTDQSNSVYMMDILTKTIKTVYKTNNTTYLEDPAIGVDSYGIFVSYTKSIYFSQYLPPNDRVYWINMDSISPKVALTNSTIPANNSTNVSRTSIITIKFTEPILKSVNWTGIYVKNLTTELLISITNMTISGNTLKIITALRAANTWYQVYIPAKAVKDYAGNNLIAAYSFKFKTGST